MPLRTFVVVGVNHRTASIEQRERVALDGEALFTALAEIQDAGIDQAVILSTCNRTEIYASTEDIDALRSFFRRREGESGADIDALIYAKRDRDAATHLFRVASGLDSQVLGESEVLGQVKKAWAMAREEGSTGSLLDAIFQHALVAGKRVRTETDLGKQPVSIASLALRLAAQERPDLSEATVLIVGTGEMGRRIVQELNCYRPKSLYVVSHTLGYAEALAADGGGQALAISQIGQVLHEADVIFTVTTAPHPVLERADLAPLVDERNGRILTIFDLAVPRNTDHSVAELPNVALHDIEDLNALSDTHRKAREREVPLAEQIIHDELAEFLAACKQRTVAPMINALRERAEDIRRRQLNRALAKLGDLTAEQRETIDAMTVHLVKQLLHHPITELRGSAGHDELLAIVGRLVGLPHDRPCHQRQCTPADGD